MSLYLAERLNALADMQRNVADDLRDEYPIGFPIMWQRGRCTYSGEVVGHSSPALRICVKNSASGAVYWISAYQIKAKED